MTSRRPVAVGGDPRAARIIPLLLLLGAAGCDGENLFKSSLGVGPDDGRDPTIEFVKPDSGQRVAVGDSIRVSVAVEDQQGIARIELSGFAVQGSAQLGTLKEVVRFAPKTIDLEETRPTVRDSTFDRYLLATGDSVPADTVFLVAKVFDFAGNESADTVRIRIGGPRVHITEPTERSEFRPGAQIRVRLTARDSTNRIESLRLLATGSLTADTTLAFETPRTSVDTTVNFVLPENARPGGIELRAIARNAINDSTISPVVSIVALAPAQDTSPPLVRFRTTAPVRGEQNDSISITVLAADNIKVDSVGVTLVAIHRLATRTDTLKVYPLSLPADSATFRVSLAQLGLPAPTDTSTLRIEATAYAIDSSNNCGSATQPTESGTVGYSESCTRRNPVLGVRPGARYEILVVRGLTVRAGLAGDTIVDMAANGTHLFLSNLSRNRLEVLPIGSTDFLASIPVGSKPWGLAFNADNSRLYVANSGGTNLSVVSPTTRLEVNRVQTPNVKLYDVPFESRLVPAPGSDPESGDSIQGLFPGSVTRHDYSDRPQFIGVTTNENVIFSTVPTSAALEGTVRVYHSTQDRLEIVTDYAEERIGSRVVIANADSVFLVDSSPNDLIQVCPRNRSVNPALDRKLPVSCYVGSIDQVQDVIEEAGYDTRFLYSLNIQEIGLSDTTFVAVSGDHSSVAIGEGARTNGRVVSFQDPLGQVNGPLVKFGEIRDLVGNAAERVIGLALNQNGSLGLARGSEAFFFSSDLRLQGFGPTEAGSGGVDMHPDNPGLQRAFVSGVQPNGLAFIDVMDSFHFRRVSRIFLRDPVVGPVRAVRAGGVLRIYAITSRGLVVVDVKEADL